MAKSMLHAVVGMLVAEGRLALDAPAPVPEWADPADPRPAITLEHLLAMRDGLDFNEVYDDAGVSDVIEMLFGAGQADMAHFAADRPLAHPPGTRCSTTRRARPTSCPASSPARSGPASRTAVPAGAPVRPDRHALGRPRFDDAGTFLGSSYVYATALDYLRFGLLYLRDGVWEGRRLLPEGWVDHARRIRSYDQAEDRWYGAHWWSVGDDLGTFWASGYEGQSMMMCPPLDLLAVRLGRSTGDDHSATLRDWRAALVAAFRQVSAAVGSDGMPYHVMDEAEWRASCEPRCAPRCWPPPARTAARTWPPVWYDLDDDGTIVFNTGADTVKGRAIRRTGQVALCVQDDQPPFSFVTRSATPPGPTTSTRSAWATRLGGRYMGADRAEEYGRATRSPGSCSSGSPRRASSPRPTWPTERFGGVCAETAIRGKKGQPPEMSWTRCLPAEIQGIMPRSSAPTFSMGCSWPACRRAW